MYCFVTVTQLRNSELGGVLGFTVLCLEELHENIILHIIYNSNITPLYFQVMKFNFYFNCKVVKNTNCGKTNVHNFAYNT